jgi:hypothetical protein
MIDLSLLLGCMLIIGGLTFWLINQALPNKMN